jgi:hypothetical protein
VPALGAPSLAALALVALALLAFDGPKPRLPIYTRTTDMARSARLVRLVPKSDIGSITIRPLRWQGS